MKKMTLDCVSLIPRVISSIKSRKDVDTSVKFGDRCLEIPIIASPMKDVCDGDFGKKLADNGCFGFIHRFCSVDEQIAQFHQSKLGCAIGINGDSIYRFKALVNTGCNIFCIDIANGANVVIKEYIDRLLKINDSVQFVIGNIASKEALYWATDIPNVIGVRVGIAGGAACTTKNATGIFHPLGSLLLECKFTKKENAPLIIADGGIKGPGDFCKALALGADCVMLGSVLAVASDSPAELIKRDGRFYKVYHGSASFEIQQIYREKPKYIEGTTKFLDYENETLEQIVAKFSDGLRSCMSYMNARNIQELHENTDWCRV
jgi:IMP dehydrogenase/GMP reductase